MVGVVATSRAYGALPTLATAFDRGPRRHALTDPAVARATTSERCAEAGAAFTPFCVTTRGGRLSRVRKSSVPLRGGLDPLTVKILGSTKPAW